MTQLDFWHQNDGIVRVFRVTFFSSIFQYFFSFQKRFNSKNTICLIPQNIKNGFCVTKIFWEIGRSKHFQNTIHAIWRCGQKFSLTRKACVLSTLLWLHWSLYICICNLIYNDDHHDNPIFLTLITPHFVSITDCLAMDVMYIPPMILGRTYDVSQANVGSEIFPLHTVQTKTVIVPQYSTTLTSRIIKSDKDIQDVLSVSGSLSLKLQMGLIKLKGSGSYMKATSKNKNSVEMLIKITYKTVPYIDRAKMIKVEWKPWTMTERYTGSVLD